MVSFLLKVVLCVDDSSGPIMETSHHTSLHVDWMMGLEGEILVFVRGLLHRDIQVIILSFPE